jgi:hypothetical protein
MRFLFSPRVLEFARSESSDLAEEIEIAVAVATAIIRTQNAATTPRWCRATKLWTVCQYEDADWGLVFIGSPSIGFTP